MSTALVCLVITTFIPFVLAGLGTWQRGREMGHIDNRHPRRQWLEVKGVGARIYAAQGNAWEALGMFTAVLFVAHEAGVAPAAMAASCIVFLLARVAHAALYAANLATARSIAWSVGFFALVNLVRLAVVA